MYSDGYSDCFMCAEADPEWGCGRSPLLHLDRLLLKESRARAGHAPTSFAECFNLMYMCCVRYFCMCNKLLFELRMSEHIVVQGNSQRVCARG